MVNLSKITTLYGRGWDDETDTYTEWGNLVTGYFSTDRILRNTYMEFLKNLDEKEDDRYTNEHLSAISQSIDIDENTDDYGGYGYLFIGGCPGIKVRKTYSYVRKNKKVKAIRTLTT